MHASAKMTDSENNPRHVSYEQVKQMIDFMGQHIEFASGSLRSLEARHTSKTLWNDLTKILNNSKSGTKKTSDGWSKYWSDFKNKLKNKVNHLKKRKRLSLSKHNIKPLSRLEKRALIILGPHFERKISKVSVDPFSGISSKEGPPVIKLEAYHENENEYHNQSDCSERHSDGKESVMSDDSNEEFQFDSDGESDAPVIQSIYPKWLIEIEKKRTDADLSRAKAEEQRALVSAKNADAALIQAEAMKKLAEAADKQAEALMKIANMLECRVQNMQPM